jgi:hypothetical protein
MDQQPGSGQWTNGEVHQLSATASFRQERVRLTGRRRPGRWQAAMQAVEGHSGPAGRGGR